MLVKSTQIMGSPGNKSMKDFSREFSEGMKKWFSGA